MTKEIVKKALLIGINYIGTNLKLNGCINDAENIEEFLIENRYFNKNQIDLMTDHTKGEYYPNKENILKKFDELVEFSNRNKDKGVHIFLSYCGHGHQVKDLSGDEQDGLDEVLCPIDCRTKGFIIDDDIRSRLINRLMSNCTITVMIDACHSGSMLDLRYNYKCDNNDQCKVLDNNDETECHVVMISGCLDKQTSADTKINNQYQGAMTASFIKNFKNKISTKDLIKNMRSYLQNGGYRQVPQLTSGYKIDTNKPLLE